MSARSDAELLKLCDFRTRFRDFDDPRHPFQKWWNKHGQYMMSGGGRREMIWAVRGWIAREQMTDGVAITGESLGEKRPRHKFPVQRIAPERKQGEENG